MNLRQTEEKNQKKQILKDYLVGVAKTAGKRSFRINYKDIESKTGIKERSAQRYLQELKNKRFLKIKLSTYTYRNKKEMSDPDSITNIQKPCGITFRAKSFVELNASILGLKKQNKKQKPKQLDFIGLKQEKQADDKIYNNNILYINNINIHDNSLVDNLSSETLQDAKLAKKPIKNFIHKHYSPLTKQLVAHVKEILGIDIFVGAKKLNSLTNSLCKAYEYNQLNFIEFLKRVKASKFLMGKIKNDKGETFNLHPIRLFDEELYKNVMWRGKYKDYGYDQAESEKRTESAENEITGKNKEGGQYAFRLVYQKPKKLVKVDTRPVVEQVNDIADQELKELLAGFYYNIQKDNAVQLPSNP